MDMRTLILMITVVCSCCPAFSASPLDEACAAYNNHDYSNALKKLDAMPASARGAKASYYRALTLQALHRFDEASAEYKKVAGQRKDLRLAAMARQGLSGLAHMPKQTSYHASGSSSSADSAPGGKVAAVPPKYVTDDKWKVLKEAEKGQLSNSEGLPSNWTFVKTRRECH